MWSPYFGYISLCVFFGLYVYHQSPTFQFLFHSRLHPSRDSGCEVLITIQGAFLFQKPFPQEVQLKIESCPVSVKLEEEFSFKCLLQNFGYKNRKLQYFVLFLLCHSLVFFLLFSLIPLTFLVPSLLLPLYFYNLLADKISGIMLFLFLVSLLFLLILDSLIFSSPVVFFLTLRLPILPNVLWCQAMCEFVRC